MASLQPTLGACQFLGPSSCSRLSASASPIFISLSHCPSCKKCHTFASGRKSDPFEETVRPRQMAWMLSLLFLFTIPGNAQRQPSPPPRVDGTAAPADGDEARTQIARDMAKKANEERQAALKSDTDKLVKLAGELKSYVDKTNENVLSL